MKLPPLNALRTFEAAARLTSFSRAGDELSVTYSAVSHQIRRLEEWFGCPLFHRRGTGITLTRTGEALSAYLSPALVGLADVSQKLKLDAGGKSLSVGCIPSIASRWLVPNIAAFSQQHPEIAVRLLYAMAEERPTLGALDVLITLGEDHAPSVKSTRIFSRVNRPVASPHYLAKFGPLKTPAAIAKSDLLHDESREGWHAWFKAAGLKERVTSQGPVFQDFNMLATAVIAGHGVALCPVEVFRAEIARGDLVVISGIETNADKGYYFISAREASPAVTAFEEWFLAITS